MSASAQMRTVVRVGHKPHPIDRRKYGAPRAALFYANRKTFTEPGLVLWAFGRHFRIVPLPKRGQR